MADRWKIGLVLAAVLAAMTSACTTLPSLDPQPLVSGRDRFVPANHAAVDRLLASVLPGKDFAHNQPVIVATLVNIDDLKGSRLGRVLSEQIATRLTQRGYPAIELKLRGNIFVKQTEGELLLSREVQEITLNHKAQAVVVGTYAEAKGYVYVTIKIVDALTGQAIAAHDYALPLDNTIYSLISAGKI